MKFITFEGQGFITKCIDLSTAKALLIVFSLSACGFLKDPTCRVNERALPSVQEVAQRSTEIWLPSTEVGTGDQNMAAYIASGCCSVQPLKSSIYSHIFTHPRNRASYALRTHIIFNSPDGTKVRTSKIIFNKCLKVLDQISETHYLKEDFYNGSINIPVHPQ